jgi:ADP-heptose:LPS heptosyltransferase
MEKYIFENYLSPGDLVMFAGAIRDLHLSHPNKYITDVRTPCPAIFENNPYITPISDDDSEATLMRIEYPIVHECNDGAYHFIHGYSRDIADKLGVDIKVKHLWGDIHISDEEKHWISQVREKLGKDVPYWIIDAGCKSDYTAKMWEHQRFQEIVEAFPKVWFVQIGQSGDKDNPHFHKPLEGKNVINMIDKTDLRQLIRMFYHAYGVITPVSLPMHLAAAVEMKDSFKRKSRPCIVLAGGREPSHWEMYTNHAYFHACGMLECCDMGGCWKSRIVPLNDGDDKDKDLCLNPVKTKSGQVIPRCLDMVSSDDVIRAMKRYFEWKLVEEDKPKIIQIDEIKTQPAKAESKQGRNDSCNCGSGKKYKNCCGK